MCDLCVHTRTHHQRGLISVLQRKFNREVLKVTYGDDKNIVDSTDTLMGIVEASGGKMPELFAHLGSIDIGKRRGASLIVHGARPPDVL